MIYRLMLLSIALCLALTALPPARAADPISPGQTKAIEKIVHDYLIAHPEVLMEALQAAQDKDAADKVAQSADNIRKHHAQLYDDADSQVGGNPKGDVTIVEFFDYRCPYCKQAQPLLEDLLRNDRNVRIVYKEFPILGPASTYATKMALASVPQGKYQAFHRAMMDAKGTIDDQVVDRVAASVGIDVPKAKAAMEGPAIAAVIKKDLALADAINIDGTPSFIIAGKLYPGALSTEEMKKAIAGARRAHAG